MASDHGGSSFVDLDHIFAMVRRQLWVVLVGLVIGAMVGVAYLLSAVPLYTATSDILIDKGQSKIVDELASASGVFQDEAEMLSQVELLKSDQIADGVEKRLSLSENAVFMAGNPSVLRSAILGIKSLVALVTGDDALDLDEEATTREEAKALLQKNLTVERVGQTYVLRLGYTSVDPELAARITAAYGEAYLDDQLQAKYEATRRASGWLQDRIAELKEQSYNADLAVQQFRNDNGLIASGEQLVSQQQLNQINSQLIESQAQTSESKARLDQINAIIATGRTDSVVGDALSSQTINTLRDKYLDTARRETEIRGKLGSGHVQAVRLRSEMKEYERLIFGELRRIADSYQSNYTVALEREKSLEASLARVVSVNASDNTMQVKLRELERESETFKSLYDNFLQRYQQTVQQQSFPITDARIITPASVPDKPSAPKTPIVLAMFMALGVAAGTGSAALREYRDRFFRVGAQVRTELETEFLGYTPIVKSQTTRTDAVVPSLWAPGGMAAYVRQHPMSGFTETLRNVKVAVDLAMPDLSCKVIGVVSCMPTEGKSTISANLGCLLAMQGAKTLLIDGDLRNPGLSRMMAKKPDAGVVEVVLGQAPANATILADSDEKLSLLPTILKRRVANTAEILASPSMANLLTGFRSEYDYVVVDLPPLGPVVDAKAFAGRVDAFVFVIEWGRTSRMLVRNILMNNPVFHEKCLGVILNKADNSKMKFYRSYGSPEYYASRYNSYYTD
ncbi:hypothetical protein ASG54_23235 [Aureimonas sp. Leaf460]|nr:hypothetical protein ASG62_23965 [Aureimonas sp. Leaf427]KQT62224.1 hypothetical protein ASG54_23235 [Aureimonas sp. Leaf460]